MAETLIDRKGRPMSDFAVQVLSAIVATSLLAVAGGGVAWLRATYRLLSTVSRTLKEIRDELSKLRELTKNHELRLDKHDTELAWVKGAIH